MLRSCILLLGPPPMEQAGTSDEIASSKYEECHLPSFSEKMPAITCTIVRAFGIVLLGVGTLLAAGGLWLVTLAGSPYYLFAGLGLMASGFFTARCRLFPLLVLAVVALFLAPLLIASEEKGRRHTVLLAGAILLCLAAATGFAATRPHGVVFIKKTSTPGRVSSETIAAGSEWRAYGRTNLGTRYAPFDQINAANVSKLEVAWTTRRGDISRMGNEDQNTPLYADGLLYHCSPSNIVTAIDGSTGRTVWRFDPKAESPSGTGVARLPIRPAGQAMAAVLGSLSQRSRSTSACQRWADRSRPRAA